MTWIAADAGVLPNPVDPSPVQHIEKVSSPTEDASAAPIEPAGGATALADRGPLAPAPAAASQPVHGMGAVPEPATWAMLLIGFGVTAAAMRRRRRARARPTVACTARTD